MAAGLAMVGIRAVAQPTTDSTLQPAGPPPLTLEEFYKLNGQVSLNTPVAYRPEPLFEATGLEGPFYLLTGLLAILALMRVIFPKYFSDLFRVFFQTGFRQKSIREQLLQNRLASLMLNGFFFLSAGTYLYLLARHWGWLQEIEQWKGLGLCVLLIAAIYGVKYIGMSIGGWLFGIQDAADAYAFVVFLLNKIIGILLLPAITLLWLGNSGLHPVLISASLIVLLLLFFYRYVTALPVVRSFARVSGLHFFIYFCAFEILPMALMYKALLSVV